MGRKVTIYFLILLFATPIFSDGAQMQLKGFRFDTPWLGVMLTDVADKELQKLEIENGVKISKVYKDSPADKADLKMGDIIITFDGENVSTPKDLSGLVKLRKEKEQVEVQYFRNGKISSTKVTIEKRKSPELYKQKSPHIIKKKIHHSKNSVFLGVKVEQLTDQLREYFNVSDGLGVLVSEVIKNSPAEKAGIKAGDVITKVEDREVKNYNDLIRGLNYFDPNDEVEIYLVRDKSKKTVDVILEKPRDNFEKMMWIDDGDFMHDFDIDIPDTKQIDIEEIEMKLDELDKNIKIRKEVKNKDEV